MIKEYFQAACFVGAQMHSKQGGLAYWWLRTFFYPQLIHLCMYRVELYCFSNNSHTSAQLLTNNCRVSRYINRDVNCDPMVNKAISVADQKGLTVSTAQGR